MIFRQFIDEDLGCASYLIGDAGEAAVVDPSWDVGRYLDFASSHRLRITLYDLGVRADTLVATIVYLIAGAGTLAAVAHLLRI